MIPGDNTNPVIFIRCQIKPIEKFIPLIKGIISCQIPSYKKKIASFKFGIKPMEICYAINYHLSVTPVKASNGLQKYYYILRFSILKEFQRLDRKIQFV